MCKTAILPTLSLDLLVAAYAAFSRSTLIGKQAFMIEKEKKRVSFAHITQQIYMRQRGKIPSLTFPTPTPSYTLHRGGVQM